MRKLIYSFCVQTKVASVIIEFCFVIAYSPPTHTYTHTHTQIGIQSTFHSSLGTECLCLGPWVFFLHLNPPKFNTTFFYVGGGGAILKNTKFALSVCSFVEVTAFFGSKRRAF